MTEVPAALTVRPTFEMVFRTHAIDVWRVLKRLGVPSTDLEDLCQEVFVVVHRKLGEFEGRSKLTTWLFGICARVASDHRRRAYVRREQPTESPPEERRSAPQLRDLEQAEAREMLDAALAELDENKRAVFVLYEIEELSMAEVAAALECPLQTAYSRLHAARDRVHDAVLRRRGGEA